MHAFDTLSQILGVRLRGWRGIFSYSGISKLENVDMDKCWEGCTSRCAMALAMPTQPRAVRLSYATRFLLRIRLW